ncbi:MAG: hypothetical protein MZV70_54725 [Desulfobacterales bacterium]|nr:hypothetical protein [Desulfobacterales bacterium]
MPPPPLRRIGYPPLILDLLSNGRDDEHLLALLQGGRALGGGRQVELRRPAFPRAGLPHPARTGDVLLRAVLQPRARKDPARATPARSTWSASIASDWMTEGRAPGAHRPAHRGDPAGRADRPRPGGDGCHRWMNAPIAAGLAGRRPEQAFSSRHPESRCRFIVAGGA